MTLKPHQTTVWIDYEAMKGADRLIHAGALREREQALGLRSSRLGGFRIGATMELGRSMMSAGAGAGRNMAEAYRNNAIRRVGLGSKPLASPADRMHFMAMPRLSRARQETFSWFAFIAWRPPGVG
jgi:hypothetical protein